LHDRPVEAAGLEVVGDFQFEPVVVDVGESLLRWRTTTHVELVTFGTNARAIS